MTAESYSVCLRIGRPTSDATILTDVMSPRSCRGCGYVKPRNANALPTDTALSSFLGPIHSNLLQTT